MFRHSNKGGAPRRAHRSEQWLPLLSGLWFAIGLAEPGHAQTTPGVIGRERLDQKPAPLFPRAGPSRPSAASPEAPQSIAPFLLKRVVLDNSSLSPEAVEAAWRPYAGKTADQPLLTAVAQAIARLYVQADIALYSIAIPAQQPEDGVLHVVATEGHVTDVLIKGTKNRKLARAVKRMADPLMTEYPLRRSSYDALLGRLGDIPGTTISVQPLSDPATGSTRLILTLNARPVTASFNIDRRGVALLSDTVAQFDIQANSVLIGADQLRLTILSSAADDSLLYQGLSYQLRLGSKGTALLASAGRQQTRYTLLPLTGSARSFGVQISHPLHLTLRANLSMSLALDGLDSHNALLGFTLSSDRVRTIRFGGAWSMIDSRHLFSIGVTASAGLSGLGARVTRGQAKTGFRKLTVKLNASQAVGADAAARFRLSGQFTGDDLPASEQLALGGAEFGRAYPASAIGGDSGLAASIELAWRPRALPKPVKGSELYMFADAGRALYRGRYGYPAATAELASIGAGARFLLLGRHVLEVEASKGLNDPAFYAPGRARLRANLRTEF